jgi:protease-4
MRRFVVRFLAAVGALAIVLALAALAVALVARLGRSRVPSRVLLEVDLQAPLVEYVPEDPVAWLVGRDKPTVRDTVEALEKGAGDSRVAGLVATLGDSPMGVAQVQEIRDAVLAFRARGKPAIAFAETFGEWAPGNGSYYLASAFDEVWLQPSGDIGLTGLMFESPFIRGTLDKLGVQPRMDHRHEYKNAMNLFTERRYTPAHREAMEKVLGSWFGQVVRGIAQGRRLEPDQVRAAFDRGPYLGREGVDARLVDRLGYRDQAYARAKEKAGKEARLLFLSEYLRRAGRPHRKGDTVALIYGVGGVQRGRSGMDPVTGDFTMGSDTVTAAFRQAIEDDDVKAILFRVDSPGGSYVASDAIWRETRRAREKGKPVIVSMGDLAGSGGYFVAMAADKIVAQPGTITGSIGVLGGKMLTTGLWDKLGVTWDEVHTSANSTMWTGTKDYSPAEWARFQATLDRIYEDFTSKVAEGRRLPKEKVLEIAKGRIWTGEDAKGLGLVDEVGGYATALGLAKQAARIAEGKDVTLTVYPRPKSPIQRALEGRRPSSEPAAVAAAWTRAMDDVRPVVRRLREAGLWGPSDGALSMPPVHPYLR